jgi:basic membrane lipoprotein Med (substrate-binding protein (PBP1-ABC) superfamily)
MKKVIAIFAIVALAACGGASTEPTTDSATTTVDTSVTTPEVKQDTNYYKELNKKRLKELDSASK